MLGIRLPEDMEKQLSHICALSKRSKSSIVKEILSNNLEDLEDYYTAISALEDHKAYGGKTYSLKDVEKKLRLND